VTAGGREFQVAGAAQLIDRCLGRTYSVGR